MGGTVLCYVLIYLSIRTQARGFGQSTARTTDPDPAVLRRAMKYMVIFPLAYVVLTLPLAAGRMAAMRGVRISFAYYGLAGASITSCGWVDVVLYCFTRRVLLFSQAPPSRNDFGFDTLGWKHGGNDSFFGNTTTIEGPVSHKPRNRRKEQGFFGHATPRSLRTRHSDEDYFASAPEGTIATKTTVEVSTGPIPKYSGSEDPKYADSDLSMIELEDKSQRTYSLNHQ
jgi:G protein-coupled glucose receptor regulating Gpa2 C-term